MSTQTDSAAPAAPIDTGGPAFPCDTIVMRDEKGRLHGHEISSAGMTLRQYAAIKLKVPDSGTDWLDAMITKSLLNDFAGKAIPALTAMTHDELEEFTLNYDDSKTSNDLCAEAAHGIAHAMLKAQEGS